MGPHPIAHYPFKKGKIVPGLGTSACHGHDRKKKKRGFMEFPGGSAGQGYSVIIGVARITAAVRV